MPKKRTPTYSLHCATGQARCRINGPDHSLGPYGSQESREKYKLLIAEWFNHDTALCTRYAPTMHHRRFSTPNETPQQTANQSVAAFCGLRKRRGGDSNPRSPFGDTAFPVLHNRPLCHLSEKQPSAECNRHDGDRLGLAGFGSTVSVSECG